MATKRIENLIKSIHTQWQPLLGFDRLYAALYDPIRSLVEFPYVVQDGEQVEWATRPYQPASWLLDSIIDTKATRLMEQDFEQELEKIGLKHWPEDGLPQSWLAAPMMVQDRMIGVLVVENRRKPKAFGENGVRVLSSIARQVAVAIENVRLVDQRDRKIASLQALYEMGQQLNSGIRSDESAILQLIYEQASRLMDTANLYIALYDEKTDTVSFPLMYMDGQPKEVEPRRGGKGRTEWIIQNRKPILIETCVESVNWYKEYGHEYIGEPFASWVGVPMMVGNKALGVIATYHKIQDYVYTKDDQEILLLMANQAAVALDNARLYYYLEEQTWDLEDQAEELEEQALQLQKQNEQLAVLQEIAVEITSQLELEKVLSTIIERTNLLLSADFSTLFLYNSEQGRFESGMRKGANIPAPSIPSNIGYSSTIAQSKKAVFVEDAENDLGMKPTFRENKKVKSFAGVPLLCKGKTVGVLYVNYLERHDFSETEQNVIGLLANQAAVAIENAKLYLDLEERTAQLGQKVWELERAQERIAETESVLVRTSMAADFIHRMNNLAGTIPIQVNEIKERLNLDDPGSKSLLEYLSGIQEDAQELLQAAEQLRSPLPSKSVDICAILTSITRRIRIEHPARIQTALNCPTDLPPVQAVLSELASALGSIVQNGIEAMQDGGTISITVVTASRDNKQWADFEIQDQGVGISSQEMKHIFRPFYTTKKGGTGYGLWRSRNVIERLGGSIDLTSVVNQGTCFTVRLPAESK